VDFQIILLPKDGYWEWLNACRTYVMHYGVNLTNDPSTAARYMKPRQVVSFPSQIDGFVEGDIKRWFEYHHDGVRLDPIPVDSPQALRADLERRIQEKDRYAQKRKPFYLLWPTEYAVITQPFGANPQIYSRFGFPGHEGVDFRARTNTNIYACADGEVFEVHLNPNDHAYGMHVRVRHAMGYRTIYAHFQQVLVSEGQKVVAGQVLGKADSTGASTGSHLHLTLKRDGATMRGETTYPKDVLDPTPFLVWPEQSTMKSMQVPDWPHERCLVGVHGRVGEPLQEEDFKVIREAKLEAIKLESTEPVESVKRIRSMLPEGEIFLRLRMDFSRSRVEPADYVRQVAAGMGRYYRAGIRYFEINRSPNYEQDGWRRSWDDGRAYAHWFLDVQARIKQTYNDAQVGFPGLSPGGAIPGLQGDSLTFFHAAEDAVHAADWIGVNLYWRTEEERLSLAAGMLYEEVLLHVPEKLVVVTEMGNPDPDVEPDVKSRQLMATLHALRNRDGVAAAFLYPLSATEGYQSLACRLEEGGALPVIRALGQRTF